MQMRHVEFLRAWEDRTWDTETLEVPEYGVDIEKGVLFCQSSATLESDLVDWATKTLLVPGNRKYDGLAMFAVYSTEPEMP